MTSCITAAWLLTLGASLQPPITRRKAALSRHASTDEALLAAYRAEIAPDADDAWWREFVETSERPPRPAVRCVDAAAAAALRASADCEEIPWARGRGYWLSTDERPSRRVAHVTGAFYVQEAAAMVAVAALLHGEALDRRIVAIDACAAPGGKTIQLATALRDAGADAVVLANEPSSSRLGALVANAVRCGVGPWLRCTRTTGAKLFAALPRECADLILLDAPCSGDTLARREGRGLAKHLRSQPDAGAVAELAAIQMDLLRTAWPCLKLGGALVYSTCSLRPREDEAVVNAFLRDLDDAVIEDLAGLAGDGAMLRLWPQTHDTAGFFAAKLRKGGKCTVAAAPAGADDDVADATRAYLRDAWGVASVAAAVPASSTLVGRGENLWLAPAAPPLAGLKYERTGAKLAGALKVRGKAVPLARALRTGNVRVTHEFATTLGAAVDAARRAVLDDVAALAYLRGDDVDAPAALAAPVGGQCLVQHGERVLGLAKVLKGGRLKNQLPRECTRRDLAF